MPKPSDSTPTRRPDAPTSSALAYSCTDHTDLARIAVASTPAIASSISAQSATVRAIGPMWSRVSSIGKIPV